MCGITGIFNRTAEPVDPVTVRLMCDRIYHRGPDEDGYFVKNQVGLGMRRLKIIDLATGKQPIANEDGSVVVVFNGEIYNFVELRKQLEGNHRFVTHSDTECIVHAYEEYGMNFLDHLRDMFAICIWDARRRQLILARDRLGKKPIYFYDSSTNFVFGSELKCILQALQRTPPLCPEAVRSYFALGYIPAPLSIYKGVFKLRPGESMIVNEQGSTRSFYWNLKITEEPITPQEAEEEAERLILESTEIRLRSDVPLGAFLSGGVDSSLVVGAMSRFSSRPIQSFSVRFDEQYFDESNYARQVAELFGTDHHEIPVTFQPEEILRRLVDQFDEPFADTTAVPQYLLSRATRDHVTVALAGDGGDELFGGYKRYFRSLFMDMVAQSPQSLRLLFRSVLSRGSSRYFVRGADFLRRSFFSSKQRYYQYFSVFEPWDLGKILLSSEENELDSVKILERYFPAMQVTNAEKLAFDSQIYLPDDILAKVDRTSMACALEVRAPLLDHKLAEFASSLPISMKFNAYEGKLLLKKIASKYLPKSIVYRKKHGFSVPVSSWLRNELKDHVDAVLDIESVSQMGILNSSAVCNYLREHHSGKADHRDKLWAILVFQTWCREKLGWA